MAAAAISALTVAAGVGTTALLISGLGTQRSDGVADTSTIAAQVGLGAVDLALMAYGLWRALRVASGRASSVRWVVPWLLATLALWFIWAIARYAVDAS